MTVGFSLSPIFHRQAGLEPIRNSVRRSNHAIWTLLVVTRQSFKMTAYTQTTEDFAIVKELE